MSQRTSAIRHCTVIASSVAIMAGCMLSPRNGQVYESTDASVSFLAYAPYDDALIKFYAARFDASGDVDGEYVLGGCVANRGGYADGAGTRRYYCSINLPNLPLGAWTDVDVPPGYAYRGSVWAEVRSEDGTRWYDAATFDYGSPTTQCILESFGESGYAVIQDCATGSNTATIYAEVVPY